jgi:hypothetical protein
MTLFAARKNIKERNKKNQLYEGLENHVNIAIWSHLCCGKNYTKNGFGDCNK